MFLQTVFIRFLNIIDIYNDKITKDTITNQNYTD